MQKHKNITSKIIVILFLIALVVPNIIQILDLERNLINNENRKYKSMPAFNPKQPITFIGEFKNFYLENFGLKTTLVNNYIDYKSNVLHEIPIPNRVVSGKDNWLFLGNNYNKVLNNSFGNDPFFEKELENTVSYLKTISDYFASQGIPFYIVIPSDKHQVYKEFLPYKLKQNTTKLETLKMVLKNELKISIIDFNKELLKEKKNNQLYYKSDSHWNYYGAYIGYKKILETIKKDIAIDYVTLEDYNIHKEEVDAIDLAKMINVEQKEISIKLEKKVESKVEIISQSPKILHYKNEAKTTKLMLFRDSFANAMKPFLNESFSEVLYLKKHTFNKKEIIDYKPDVVIFEIIERNIDKFAELTPFKN